MPTNQVKPTIQQSAQEILNLYSQAISQNRRLRIDTSGKVHLVSGFRRMVQIFRELGKSSVWKENQICTVNIAVMKKLQSLEIKRTEPSSEKVSQPSLRERSPKWLEEKTHKLGDSLPLGSLNTLLTQALDSPTSKQSLGTIRAAMQFCFELRRDSSSIESIYSQASQDENVSDVSDQLAAQTLLFDIAKKFRLLSAQIDLNSELQQKFGSSQPILRQTIEIIETYEKRLLKKLSDVEDLRDGVLALSPDVMSQLRLYSPSTLNQSFKIIWSRTATNAAFKDLINRVTDATSPHAYETALKRIDNKINELKHALDLFKARATQNGSNDQVLPNYEGSWQDAIDNLTAIRHRIAENFDLKYPSKWQGSEVTRLCGELVSVGPQICADLLTDVHNAQDSRKFAIEIADLSSKLKDDCPALKQLLKNLPNAASFDTKSKEELSLWENSLGLVHAEIGALGRKLATYRNQLLTNTSNASVGSVEDYDEAISRLAAINVLLVMRIDAEFKNSVVARSNPDIAKGWSDKLKLNLSGIQSAAAALLSEVPPLTIALIKQGDHFVPTITSADGSLGTLALKWTQKGDFIGETASDAQWKMELASAWRKVRISPHADTDSFDQLITGINFLKARAV